ncbi:MAG: ABC transporter substrate-binding protein [Archangiaceae bacterium]|nr:ABC transporter substrate-binding protein [Archangiaceae bacterium]
MKKLIALALCLSLPALAADRGEEAKKRTQAFVDNLMKVKSADDGKELSKADKDANAKVFAELDGFFDWAYLTSEPVATRADKFSKPEREEFDKKFKEVIRLVAYPDSGAFFRKAKWSITTAKDEGGDKATVRIEASRDDLETKVDMKWKLIDGSLLIYDVAFDGDSLVQDYKNQMSRIIDKGGVKDLLAKIDKRKAELEKPAAPAKDKKK